MHLVCFRAAGLRAPSWSLLPSLSPPRCGPAQILAVPGTICSLCPRWKGASPGAVAMSPRGGEGAPEGDRGREGYEPWG